MCMDKAGMLTYILPHTLHFLALFESSVLCVCNMEDVK